MQLTTVPLSSLLAPKGNPRTTYDKLRIAGLAQSIRTDGVLQNLLVRPDGRDKFRVVAGKRRHLALQLLKKEALLLLLGLRLDFGLRLSLHSSLMSPPADWNAQRSYRAIDEEGVALADRLGLKAPEDRAGGPAGIQQLLGGHGAIGLLDAVGQLADEELERLVVLLPVLCFGQENEERFDTGDSLFNTVATALGVGMRDWWTPSAAFLSCLVRDQVLATTTDSGAQEQIQGAAGMTKKDLVAALSAFFAAEGTNGMSKAKTWLPGVFRFPAAATLASEANDS